MSEASSEAPVPQGAPLPANMHPFFSAASRGRGGGRGRGRGRQAEEVQEEPQVGPRLVPIDLHQVEANVRATHDDAESEIFSDEEEERQRAAKPPPAKRPRAERVQEAAASAAFGSSDPDGASEAAETESQVGSEARFDRQVSAQKRCLPIRGISCIGCGIDSDTIGKLDVFVKANQCRLEPTALFKSAAAFWKQSFCDTAGIRGEPLPLFGWKDIRSHYLLHRVDPAFQRIDSIRSLAACRKTIEASLIRQDEDGSRSLDGKQADLLLKVIAMQSKELGLLSSASMPPPPPPGRRGQHDN